jgi:hypothetical protein
MCSPEQKATWARLAESAKSDDLEFSRNGGLMAWSDDFVAQMLEAVPSLLAENEMLRNLLDHAADEAAELDDANDEIATLRAENERLTAVVEAAREISDLHEGASPYLHANPEKPWSDLLAALRALEDR